MMLAAVPTGAASPEVVSVYAMGPDVVEYTNGHWENDDGTDWYRYYTPELYYTVTFDDGTSVSGYPWFLSDEYGISVFCTSVGQSADNPLGIGTHYGECYAGNVSGPYQFEIVECPIESFYVTGEYTLIENSGGIWNTESNGDKWFYYYPPSVKCSVLTKDGEIITGWAYEIEEAIGYYPTYTLPDQTYQSQLTVGSYSAEATLCGLTSSFTFDIIENPIKSLSVYCSKSVFEYTGGYWETTNGVSWYVYYQPRLIFIVETTDGRVYEGDSSYIYENLGYYPRYYPLEQSADSPLGVGVHTGKAILCGIEATYTFEILETPIKSISAVCTTAYDEFTNGHYREDNGIRWYKYDAPYSLDITVEMTDGTVHTGGYWSIQNALGQSISITMPEQTAEAPLLPGTHTCKLSVMGCSAEFDLTINEFPYESIEIISVNTVFSTDGTNYDFESGSYYYVPDFTYKLTLKDGSTVIDRYNYRRSFDSNLVITHDQANNPWTEGGENPFTVTLKAISTSGNAKFEKVNVTDEPIGQNEYDYFVQDMGAVITAYNDYTYGTLTIPEEIDGYTVVGIDNIASNYVGDIEKIIIPDTVRFIGENVFSDKFYNLMDIEIGSGVSYLEDSMFNAPFVESITVSEANADYCSVNGVVFDADCKKIVVFPMGRSGDYTLPDGVEDISVLYERHPDVTPINSDGTDVYVTENGVTYSPDMKTVIKCDTDVEGKYVMPETVETIAPCAFDGCTALTGVKISDSVTEITYGAFAGCSSLAEITVPESVVSIDDYAFTAAGINDVSLPGVEYIGKYAFQFCEMLKNVSFGSSLDKIDANAFECSGIVDLFIPEGTTELGNGAFAFCEDLTSVSVPQSITELNNTFMYCEKLTDVTLREGLERLDGAFSGCSSLEEIALPKSLCDLGYSTFSGCEALKSITLPEKITVIGGNTFSGCSNLESVNAEGVIKSIGSNAFSGTGLTQILLNDGLEYIDIYAFRNSSLTSVTIPETVTELVYGSFLNSTALTEINVPDTAIAIGGHALDSTAWFEGCADGEAYVGNHFYKYKGDILESTTVTLKDGTLTVADYAFENCIYNADYLEEYYGYRFYDMSGLKKVVLPEGLMRIGRMAFVRCYGLEEVILPEGLITIEDGAFANCTALRSIHLPSTVKEISTYAFVCCSGIEEFTVDEDNPYYTSVDGILYTKDMSELVFCPPARNRDVVIPRETLYVRDNAFDMCEGISVTVKNSKTEFAPYALGYICEFHTGSGDTLYFDFYNLEVYPHFICSEGSKAQEHADKQGIAYIIVAEEIELENNTTGITVSGTTSENLSEDVVLVTECLDVSEKEISYDIYLTREGETIQPTGTVEVTIPVPSGFRGIRCKVYYCDEDGNRTDMDARLVDGCLVFEVDHFSNYIISELELIYGDASCDENVSTKDILLIRKYLADIVSDQELDTIAADVSGDENITVMDVLMIRKFLADIITEFPAEN